jgi:hypothetical protein
MEVSDMFKLELDISLYFVPPMAESGRGICVTHEFELPFSPSEGMGITGIVFNGSPSPIGCIIKQLTWDIDRQVFFAQNADVMHDLPIALIPLEICRWIDLGWTLGSYESTYEKADGRGTRVQRKPLVCKWKWKDEDTAHEWESIKPRSRPEGFNNLFKAIIREMAMLDNNSAVAYAMDRTKMFFSEEQLDHNDISPAKKFRDAQSKFEGMSFDEQYDWRNRISRRYPRLEQFVLKRPRHT